MPEYSPAYFESGYLRTAQVVYKNTIVSHSAICPMVARILENIKKRNKFAFNVCNLFCFPLAFLIIFHLFPELSLPYCIAWINSDDLSRDSRYTTTTVGGTALCSCLTAFVIKSLREQLFGMH